ncbi:hypothetical protein [Stenotrophomonas phage CM2]
MIRSTTYAFARLVLTAPRGNGDVVVVRYSEIHVWGKRSSYRYPK